MSADPDKIQYIVQAGRPEMIEDMRSLLQAAAYNAKFGFDHLEEKSYKEVTAPSEGCSSRTPTRGGTRSARPASRPC